MLPRLQLGSKGMELLRHRTKQGQGSQRVELVRGRIELGLTRLKQCLVLLI